MHHTTKLLTKYLICIFSVTSFSCVTQPVFACMDSDSVYMGTVCVTANSFCPRGYTEAQGQLLSINENTALYSLLGTTYGGDGRTVFALPDLRGRSMVGLGRGPGLITTVVPGQKRGQEMVTQTIDQMPSHSHTAVATGGGSDVKVSLSAKTVSGQNAPQEGYMLGAGGGGPAAANMYVPPSSSASTVKLGGVDVSSSGGDPVSVTIGNTGGSQEMTNIPPQTGLRFCIALQGLYPPRQ